MVEDEVHLPLDAGDGITPGMGLQDAAEGAAVRRGATGRKREKKGKNEAAFFDLFPLFDSLRSPLGLPAVVCLATPGSAVQRSRGEHAQA